MQRTRVGIDFLFIVWERWEEGRRTKPGGAEVNAVCMFGAEERGVERKSGERLSQI